MKKKLLALLALAAAIAPSCNKQDTQTPTPIVSVRFNLGGIESGQFPTKGMADAITATLPAVLDLTLTNTATGVTYTTTTGTAVEIPVGTYSVTGGYTPDIVHQVYGATLFISHAPKVAVSEAVEVTEGVAQYTLTAQYQCVALAVPDAEVTKWQGADNNKNGYEIDFLREGAYRWVFLSGEIGDSRYFVTTLYPADGTAYRTYHIVENTRFQINFSDCLVVTPGHWYILRASDSVMQSGSFGVTWPAWSQG